MWYDLFDGFSPPSSLSMTTAAVYVKDEINAAPGSSLVGERKVIDIECYRRD